MNLSLTSSLDVFMFIIFCSFYVCSVLWIYGDVATRNGGWKGMLFPLIFVVTGTFALIEGHYLSLLVWPLGYLIWFIKRPPLINY